MAIETETIKIADMTLKVEYEVSRTNASWNQHDGGTPAMVDSEIVAVWLDGVDVYGLIIELGAEDKLKKYL